MHKIQLFIMFGLLALFACKEADKNVPCTPTTWYRDADGDGAGDPNASKESCTQPEGFVANNNDTDDESDDQIAARRTALLNYISNLSSDTFNGAIAGQNCFHGNEITGENGLDGYASLISALHDATGKWVGIVGVDYEFSKLFSPAELSSANQVLINHWKNGGLVTINLTPFNPWVNDESDVIGNPGTYNGPGSTGDKTGVTSLNDLVDDSKDVGKAWKRKLDRMAEALLELKHAGVIVLWRPMQEMNGNWFWWGMASHAGDPAPYINVYRHMHDYFANTKGLNNLIWVYSPNDSYGQDLSSDWNRPVDWAYPGDTYVDIVAGTVYNDNLDIADYDVYKSLGKPMGIAEYGPLIGGDLEQNGTLDTRLYAMRIKNDYPRIAYWVSWHCYSGVNWALICNQHYNELLNSDDIITREEISF